MKPKMVLLWHHSEEVVSYLDIIRLFLHSEELWSFRILCDLVERTILIS